MRQRHLNLAQLRIELPEWDHYIGQIVTSLMFTMLVQLAEDYRSQQAIPNDLTGLTLSWSICHLLESVDLVGWTFVLKAAFWSSVGWIWLFCGFALKQKIGQSHNHICQFSHSSRNPECKKPNLEEAKSRILYDQFNWNLNDGRWQFKVSGYIGCSLLKYWILWDPGPSWIYILLLLSFARNSSSDSWKMDL